MLSSPVLQARPDAPRTLAALRQLFHALPPPNAEAQAAAVRHQKQLTKPENALGRLEELACWYQAWRPGVSRLSRSSVVLFAGNHGLAHRGVSAFPMTVTRQMVENFKKGGAAINQLAALAGAELCVYDLRLQEPTRDCSTEPAMDEKELLWAFNRGFACLDPSTECLVLGEMGIGNSSAAAALYYALYGGHAADWTGPGTGLSDEGLAHKIGLVQTAVQRWCRRSPADPLEALRQVGGFEIAALCGAILAARLARVPVILDGFVCCAAAAVVHALASDALAHCLIGHLSSEPAHERVCQKLAIRPILNLEMRLGEASGAALALTILKAALACHTGMARFETAGVDRSNAGGN